MLTEAMADVTHDRTEGAGRPAPTGCTAADTEGARMVNGRVSRAAVAEATDPRMHAAVGTGNGEAGTASSQSADDASHDVAPGMAMVEGAPFAVMFADRDLTIRYLNAASRTTLQDAGPPAAGGGVAVLGANLNLFITRPAQQRYPLADPANLPYHAEIALGSETIELQVTAVRDAMGRHVGSMVCWAVITERVTLAAQTRALQQQERAAAEALQTRVEAMLDVVNAAAAGDLTREVAVNGTDAVGQMGEGLQRFLADLRVSVAAIGHNAQTLASASEQLTAVGDPDGRQRRGDQCAGQRRLGRLRAGEPERPDGGHRHRGDEREHPRDRQERPRRRQGGDRGREGRRDDQRHHRQARREQRGDRQGHQGDHLDRPADQPAGAERDDRGGARRRRGQGLRRGRQRGQGAGQGNRQGHRGHQPEDRGDPDRHPGATRAIAEISKIINQINDISNTIASAVEEQTATTNEIARNVTDAARGSSEIAHNIIGVAQAARSTSDGAADSQIAAAGLARMASELQALVARFSC